MAELMLVDATPSALRYVPYDAAFVANPAIAQNGYFFALSATPSSTRNALSVFQLSQVKGPNFRCRCRFLLPAPRLWPRVRSALVGRASGRRTVTSFRECQ